MIILNIAESQITEFILTSTKFMPKSLRLQTKRLISKLGQRGKSSFQSCKEVTPDHISSFGVPRILNILNNSSISESPGKSGFLVAISAIMAPTDHISTGNAYVLHPSKISGAYNKFGMNYILYTIIYIEGKRTNKINDCGKKQDNIPDTKVWRLHVLIDE